MLNLFLFTSLFVSLLSSTFTSSSTLPFQELEALKNIAKALKNTKWNFSVNPCDVSLKTGGWRNPYSDKYDRYAVTCECSGTVCHVISIELKAQNLQGILPAEMVGLPFLRQIDLSRNYLNGSIPPEWGKLPLVNVSLLGNRLTGPIPKEIGNISTLHSFVLENNQFSGKLPPELGNLSNIQRLLLSSNYFSGEIPTTFAKLTAMKEFLIGDNHFTGPLPDFIKDWTGLDKLFIQGSGLVGPIFDTIGHLTMLTELRISDLGGPESPIPQLGSMKGLKIVIMRNCNLIGELPLYFGELQVLQVLDLSFNKLSGPIPQSYNLLQHVGYIYFTHNMLNGTIPSWILDRGQNIDLSYNNFAEDPSTAKCRHNNLNLFSSSSKAINSQGISCLRSYDCPKTFYGPRINCGGDEVTINKIKYDADNKDTTVASFYDSNNGWVSSNTGHFLNDERPSNRAITWRNSSQLNMTDSQLYTQARLSAISLTYYAFCLKNGNYTVKLHFAEIMFTNDKSFSSLGRRFFDIYLQGKPVKEDFNIVDAAGGAGKAVVENFTVAVTNGTLEIRFYWAGKGTTSMPTKGVYGPLISAISVDPLDFQRPNEETGGKITTGVVVGIVIASIILVGLFISGILWWRGNLRPKSQMERDFRSLDFKINAFSLWQIKAATSNFDPSNKIGEGGFGPVYKGHLPDGTVIAVKQLSAKSKQGNREFLNEIGMISALQHPNLVKLYGCCVEGDQLLLVYEYLENNSLARALFGPEATQLKLDWPTRQKICVGIARGLAYLHEESRLKIVHRDIKATNVLLDNNLNPKISDFGLAKLDEDDNTHISTRVAGTFGYMAPEYAMRGHLSDKADVYSFGVVALEIVSGRTNASSRLQNDYLLDWLHVLKKSNNLLEMVDPRLGREYNEEEVMVMINVAILCTSQVAMERPSMSTVVSMLEGRMPVEIQKLNDEYEEEEESVKERKKHYKVIEEDISQTVHSNTSSTIEPFTSTSSVADDLYPLKLDSAYWDSRV